MSNSKDDVYQWGKEISKYSPRIPGTNNIEKVRDFIVKQLKSFGLKTWLEPINFRGIFHQDWEFRVGTQENRIFVSCPQNNVGFSSVDAELVDVGKGTINDYDKIDVKGKIVFINWGKLTDHEGPCGFKKSMQVVSDLMLTTEDTWDKIDPLQLYKDVSVYITLAKILQRIPGRILRSFEFPGRSFFGCGTLFKDSTQPKYPDGKRYEAEKTPPLLIGGFGSPLKTKDNK